MAQLNIYIAQQQPAAEQQAPTTQAPLFFTAAEHSSNNTAAASASVVPAPPTPTTTTTTPPSTTPPSAPTPAPSTDWAVQATAQLRETLGLPPIAQQQFEQAVVAPHNAAQRAIAEPENPAVLFFATTTATYTTIRMSTNSRAINKGVVKKQQRGATLEQSRVAFNPVHSVAENHRLALQRYFERNPTIARQHSHKQYVAVQYTEHITIFVELRETVEFQLVS
jgi:hypothetical protein